MKYFFGWENIKKAIWEWLMTFSKKDSLWSSKRITQFTFGFVGISLIIFVVLYNRDKFTATDNVIMIGPLFVYGGYALNKVQEEKKVTLTAIESPNTQEISKETT